MLLPEQIEEALSEGRLNFNEVQQVVRWFDRRALADLHIGMNKGDKRDNELTIKHTSQLITEVLEKSKLSASERLTLAESKIKNEL